MSTGCLVRVTTALPTGHLKAVIYVVAEPNQDAAIAILKAKIPTGAEVEHLGHVAESFVQRLALAPGGFTEV
jgi:hypothetical protein